MAINKFPKLPRKKKDELFTWIHKERHERLAEYHSYEACGNEDAALKNKHFAECLEYIHMMMNYHEEEKQ